MRLAKTETRIIAEKRADELYHRLDEIYQSAPYPFDPSAPYPLGKKEEFLALEREYEALTEKFWPR